MWLSRNILKINIKNLGYRVHLNNAIHFSATDNVLLVATFGVRAKPYLILPNIYPRLEFVCVETVNF